MSDIKIISNYVPRPILYGYELSPQERTEFDYYTDDEIEEQTFFRYKGNVYDLSEFLNSFYQSNPFKPYWDSYMSDSFFSGILIHFVIDKWGANTIIVGWYVS